VLDVDEIDEDEEATEVRREKDGRNVDGDIVFCWLVRCDWVGG